MSSADSSRLRSWTIPGEGFQLFHGWSAKAELKPAECHMWNFGSLFFFSRASARFVLFMMKYPYSAEVRGLGG